MMPVIIRVKRDYHEMSWEEFVELVNAVRNGISSHPVDFDYTKTPKPPYTDVEFEAFISDAVGTHTIYKQGGRAQKPAADKAYKTLMGVVDEFADYVDEVANGDEGKIVISGFNVAYGSTPGQKQTEPSTPDVNAVHGEASGEIDSETDSFGRDAKYTCIISEEKPLDTNTTLTTDGKLLIPPGYTNRIFVIVDIHRKKKITGLKRGTDYWIYYIVSNTAGVSPLSAGFQIMCV